MKLENRKSVNDKLNKYCPTANKGDFIEVTEWVNGEGYDITMFNKVTGIRHMSLTYGELDAINYLTKALEIEQE